MKAMDEEVAEASKRRRSRGTTAGGFEDALWPMGRVEATAYRQRSRRIRTIG